ncbi:MAG: structural protein P5 [Marinobacter sp.]|nr:structural protein P5 [Marinobacter sp.]
MNLTILGALGAGVYLAVRSGNAGTGSEAPRGIRNNNPGNIEKGANWQGLATDQSPDSRFAVFISPVWGIRAMARTLNTYRNRDGLPGLGGPGIDTVREVISRWAPSGENKTEAYIRAVSDYTGLDPEQTLYSGDYAALIKGIIHHENGVQPYPDSLINQGIELA